MKKKLLCAALTAAMLTQYVLSSVSIASANQINTSSNYISSATTGAAVTATTSPVTPEPVQNPLTDNDSDSNVSTQADEATSPFILADIDNTSNTKGSSKSKSIYTSSTYTHDDAFDGMNIYNGIDVSYHNNAKGAINWTKVKAAGTDYVFIRVGYRGYGASGTLCTDTSFKTNIEGALAAGLKVGVYYFTEALNTTEAIEEANYCIDKIAGYDVTFPVVIDYEFPTSSGSKVGRMYNANLSKSTATANVKAFCKTIKSAGYTPMVYASKSDLSSLINGTTLAKSYKIWMANYTTDTEYSGTYEYWQYSSKGSVSGITGNVDCNFWYTNSTLSDSSSSATATPTTTTSPTSTPTATESTSTATPSPTATANTTAGTPSTFSGSSAAKTITLKWSGNNNANGYQIYRKTTYNGSYSKIKTITSGNTLTFKNTGLASDHEYYYKIRSYNNTGSKTTYSSYKTLTIATLSHGQAAVTSAKLTLLKTPSASAAKLKVIPKKATIVYLGRTILKNGKKFLHIKYVVSGKTYTGYLLTSASSSLKYHTLGTTTADALNLRKAAGTSNESLITIPTGTPIAILGSTKVGTVTWYKTSYLKGSKLYTGYVSSDYIKK